MSRTKRQSWRVEWADFWLKWGRGPAKWLTSRKFQERDGCGKPPGHELWSRRPCSGWGNANGKPVARRMERARAKAALRKEIAGAD